MADVRIKHPVTGGEADVPMSALTHLRQAGWQTAEEYAEGERLREQARLEREAAEAQAQADAAAAAKGKTGTKAGSSEEK